MEFPNGTQSYLALTESMVYSMKSSFKPLLSDSRLNPASTIDVVVENTCIAMIDLVFYSYLNFPTSNIPIDIEMSRQIISISSKSSYVYFFYFSKDSISYGFKLNTASYQSSIFP